MSKWKDIKFAPKDGTWILVRLSKESHAKVWLVSWQDLFDHEGWCCCGYSWNGRNRWVNNAIEYCEIPK